MRGAGSCGESLKTASDRFSEPSSESRSRQLMTALRDFRRAATSTSSSSTAHRSPRSCPAGDADAHAGSRDRGRGRSCRRVSRGACRRTNTGHVEAPRERDGCGIDAAAAESDWRVFLACASAPGAVLALQDVPGRASWVLFPPGRAGPGVLPSIASRVTRRRLAMPPPKRRRTAEELPGRGGGGGGPRGFLRARSRRRLRGRVHRARRQGPPETRAVVREALRREPSRAREASRRAREVRGLGGGPRRVAPRALGARGLPRAVPRVRAPQRRALHPAAARARQRGDVAAHALELLHELTDADAVESHEEGGAALGNPSRARAGTSSCSRRSSASPSASGTSPRTPQPCTTRWASWRTCWRWSPSRRPCSRARRRGCRGDARRATKASKGKPSVGGGGGADDVRASGGVRDPRADRRGRREAAPRRRRRHRRRWTCLAPFKSRDPADEAEEEWLENVFDALCATAFVCPLTATRSWRARARS